MAPRNNNIWSYSLCSPVLVGSSPSSPLRPSPCIFSMWVCSSHETILSTRRNPAQPVSVPILQSYKRYKFCGQKNYATKILQSLCSEQSGQQCNGASSYRIRQARRTHSMTEREQKKQKNKERKNRQKEKNGHPQQYRRLVLQQQSSSPNLTFFFGLENIVFLYEYRSNGPPVLSSRCPTAWGIFYSQTVFGNEYYLLS